MVVHMGKRAWAAVSHIVIPKWGNCNAVVAILYGCSLRRQKGLAGVYTPVENDVLRKHIKGNVQILYIGSDLDKSPRR